MCGIVAAASNRNVVPILLDGLVRLEYRGYDSAGIALAENNKVIRIRKQGKVAELHKAIKKQQNFKSSTGVAHTRWATHGEPSEINAHPHFQSMIIQTMKSLWFTTASLRILQTLEKGSQLKAIFFQAKQIQRLLFI